MKWGLIARSETDRGLGIQTFAMWENLHPDRTLVVVNEQSGFDSHPELYPGATLVTLEHGPDKNRLHEWAVRNWWRGLDAIVTVETLYDWDLVEWARADGVRTIVHGNPEFWMATNPQPDAWWWPTPWRSEYLPTGPVVSVPVPDVPITARPAHDGTLSLVHVAGNAMADRNGTALVAQAMRSIPAKNVDLHVHTQMAVPRFYRDTTIHKTVADRWSIYRGRHVLVLPRRYGGLCLPVLEAMASGLAVIMTDCSPNETWPVILLNADPDRIVDMQTGPVRTYIPQPQELVYAIRDLVGNRAKLDEYQSKAREWAKQNTWSVLAPMYYDRIHEAIRSSS